MVPILPADPFGIFHPAARLTAEQLRSLSSYVKRGDLAGHPPKAF